MVSPMTTVTPPLTLADTLPAVRWRDAVLVGGAVLLTAAAAQVSIPLGFTPVPVTGQTLAVLLIGATLGAKRAVLSQALYWMLGAAGLPFYASGDGGWEAATGSTFGYFIGFVLAAALVGKLAERGQDRTLLTSFTAMLAGTAIIYATGVSWLAWHLSVPFYSEDGTNAFALGLAPFIVGDTIKLVIAASLTPAVWALLRRGEH
jgi:biotin transport system substrate-specific component